MRTLKELAKEAYDVQDACNLSGVVHSLAKAVGELWAQPDCEGTDWVNTHPVTVLFVDKLASLAGCQDVGNDAVTKAYDEVRRLMEGA